jgi:TBC1 domain family member 8/9
MVVLADEILESFFETDLSSSFKLEHVPAIELPESAPGILGGLWSAVNTEDNRRIFNRFTDELGKAVGRHQVIHKPSIGRYTTLEEPKARESLLTPSMRKSSSSSSLRPPTSLSPASSRPSSPTTPTKALPSRPVEVGTKTPPEQISRTSSKQQPPPPTPEFKHDLVAAANAALMERTPFAIDDAGDEDDSELDDDDEAAEDGMMDEVDAFLEAHDPGLSEADKALQQGESSDIL